MLSEKEFGREARLFLRRLGKTNGRLIATDQPGGKWQVLSIRNSYSRPVRHVEDEFAQELVSRGWLKRLPDGSWRMSALGQSWLDGSRAGPGAPSDTYASQHQDRKVRPRQAIDGDPGAVVVNEAENPLGWLKARKDKNGDPLISEEQFDAAERLRRDFTFAQLSPKVTQSWDQAIAPGSRGRASPREVLNDNERALAAKQRFEKALKVLGPELSSVVFEVCCLASGLEAAERRLGWPQRTGKVVLKIALSRLAVHYGLIREEPSPLHAAKLRHWGGDGYRPEL